MKVAFYTLGCKVNQYETSLMVENFKKNGYEIVDFLEKANIYVINTCTVTNMSDKKSRQIMQKAKRNNKSAVIVAVGCLAQVGSEKLKNIPQIDLILGNNEKKNIVKYITQYLDDRNRNIYVSDIMKKNDYLNEQLSTSFEKTRAVIKIQDGCNSYCSYCIIPYARGRIRSKPFDDVIKEVKAIIKNGYKEIVLTGIHVCSYGVDLENISLIDLLESLNQITGLERIRLSSLEPNIINEEFLERLSKLHKICPHFHLSLQSGSDEILKSMNRKYTTKDIEKMVHAIRKYYVDCNITADIIVGFPGETDEEFNRTYEFLKNLQLNKLHVFKYSKREGTVAEKMDNQINPKIKHQRSKKLIDLSNYIECKILKKYINKEVEILTEEVNGKNTKGFTRNYLHAHLNDMCNSNELVKAIVIGVEGNHLICAKI